MIEIHQNLFVGNQDDYELNVARQGGWAVVHACKEPYHRAVLGYRGRGAPKDNPEYLVARRGDRLILNLVDADNPAYIPQEIIDTALSFISEKLAENLKVLVHCNQGMSRSPSIGLLYLVQHTDKLPKDSFAEAERAFREFYPLYNPAGGVRGFIQSHWNFYTVQSGER